MISFFSLLRTSVFLFPGFQKKELSSPQQSINTSDNTTSSRRRYAASRWHVPSARQRDRPNRSQGCSAAFATGRGRLFWHAPCPIRIVARLGLKRETIFAGNTTDSAETNSRSSTRYPGACVCTATRMCGAVRHARGQHDGDTPTAARSSQGRMIRSRSSRASVMHGSIEK